MNDVIITRFDDESLAHYGRKGMKWHKHIFGDEGVENRYRKVNGNYQPQSMGGTVKTYGKEKNYDSYTYTYNKPGYNMGGISGTVGAKTKGYGVAHPLRFKQKQLMRKVKEISSNTIESVNKTTSYGIKVTRQFLKHSIRNIKNIPSRGERRKWRNAKFKTAGYKAGKAGKNLL